MKEHLRLVCDLKNIDNEKMADEIDEIIDLLLLREHNDKMPEKLSGGMKRKLSLAMALVGGSRLIILDEPTSGLDAESCL